MTHKAETLTKEQLLKYKPEKAFKELTDKEKEERMNIYKKQREIYNVEESLFAITKIHGISTNKDGSKRFCLTAKDYKTNEYIKFYAYIGKGKESLERFYKSLTVGKNVSIHYSVNNVGGTTFYNAKQIILR